MVEIRKGNPGELPAIRDFINMVFSMNSEPHNFKEMLPKIYGDQAGTEPYHYIAAEDGSIKAVVCSWPVTYTFGGQSLKAATIGSVSAHPYSRGKGYMKLLMNAAVEDMKKEGYDLSVLDGYRQRYRYFGYECGGSRLEYRFSMNALKHAKGAEEESAVTLRTLGPEDREYLHKAYELYINKPLHCERAEKNFYHILCSWSAVVYGIFQEGALTGYLVDCGGHIAELVLEEEKCIFSALKAYGELLKREEITIPVYPWETERAEYLAPCYGGMSVVQDGNYQIFNFESVLRFSMAVASKMKPLTDGELVVAVEGQENLAIAVSAGVPSVSCTGQAADCKLTPLEAVAFFFSPVMGRECTAVSAEKRLNWFPLPLSVSHQDRC